MLKWLDGDDILIYSTYNEYKSVVDGKFIITMKGKICKKNDIQ